MCNILIFYSVWWCSWKVLKDHFLKLQCEPPKIGKRTEACVRFLNCYSMCGSVSCTHKNNDNKLSWPASQLHRHSCLWPQGLSAAFRCGVLRVSVECDPASTQELISSLAPCACKPWARDAMDLESRGEFSRRALAEASSGVSLCYLGSIGTRMSRSLGPDSTGNERFCDLCVHVGVRSRSLAGRRLFSESRSVPCLSRLGDLVTAGLQAFSGAPR